MDTKNMRTLKGAGFRRVAAVAGGEIWRNGNHQGIQTRAGRVALIRAWGAAEESTEAFPTVAAAVQAAGGAA